MFFFANYYFLVLFCVWYRIFCFQTNEQKVNGHYIASNYWHHTYKVSKKLTVDNKLIKYFVGCMLIILWWVGMYFLKTLKKINSIS